MAALKTLLFVAFCGASILAFKFEQCGDPNSSILKVKQLDVKPEPIVIPGEAEAEVKLEVTEKVSPNARLKVKVERHVSFWGEETLVPVPCIDNFGSCDYNVCDLLKKLEPILKPHWPKGKDYSCPIEPGTYGGDGVKKVKLPAIELLYKFSEATYDIEVRGVDGGRELGCFKFTAAIKVPDDF